MRAKPLILVVDDSPLNRKMLRKMLGRSGYELLEADSGQAALDIARGSEPDLILLDIMMPGMDGFAVCTELQAAARTSGIPVIFISAMDDTDSIVKGLEIGGVDYVRKPFAMAEVLARVKVHLGLKYARERLVQDQMKMLEELGQTQKSFLIDPQDMSEARFEYVFQPVLEAGGDFLDVVHLGEGNYAYIIADVSGHSLGTAYLTSALKIVFEENLALDQPVQEVLSIINAVLKRVLGERQFLTAGVTLINREEGSLKHFNAGHHPPVLVPGAGESEFLEGSGDLLGMFDKTEFGCVEREVQTGDRIFFYTDGLIETSDYGYSGKKAKEDLYRACISAKKEPLKTALDRIVQTMCPPPCGFHDDMIIMGTEI